MSDKRMNNTRENKQMTLEEKIEIDYQKRCSQTKAGENFPIYPQNWVIQSINEFSSLQIKEVIEELEKKLIEVGNLKTRDDFEDGLRLGKENMIDEVLEILNSKINGK